MSSIEKGFCSTKKFLSVSLYGKIKEEKRKHLARLKQLEKIKLQNIYEKN
jgi:hypothetical protein